MNRSADEALAGSTAGAVDGSTAGAVNRSTAGAGFGSTAGAARGAVADFASGAMIQLLRAGLADAGLPPQPASVAFTGRVPLDAKRALIGAVVTAGGAAALLRIGAGIGRLNGDPVHQALSVALDPNDFVARWQRLERYIHSRHRIAVLASNDHSATLRHAAPDEPQPTPHESLLVLGVIAAGCTLVGAQGLRVSMDGHDVLPETDPALIDRLVAARRASVWALRWNGCASRAARSAIAAPRHPADLCAPLPWPETAHRIAVALLADPAQTPTLASLARLVGTSGRSLQRELAAYGLTPSAVVAETRCRAAAWWLHSGDRPVAEVGFICGFSDQPHFTREFGLRVGVTPARYRREFGAAAAVNRP